jgi:general stress protein 26
MQKTNLNKQRLAELIRDMRFTMMSTIDGDGAIYSRPMVNLSIDEQQFDGKLWFFTKRDSPKVQSIKNDQHVNLAYADPSRQRFVSLAGQARLVEDREKMQQLWSPELKEWFPDGLEEPGLSLICVEAQSAEVWDDGPSESIEMLGIATAFGALGADEKQKNKSQGERFNLGQ